MGNLISHFQSPQADTAAVESIFSVRTSTSGSFTEDSGTESAGTNRPGSLASVETINEVENNQVVHYGISERNQRKIQRMFKHLKDNIDIDGILDHFIEDGDLTEDAQEQIVYNNPRRKQVELFLFKVFRFKSNAFDRFLKYIREDQCLVHLADQLQNCDKLPGLEDIKLKPHEIRHQIERYKEDILKQIEPEEIAEYLIVYEVCEINEYEHVVSQIKTSKEKGLALLEMIQRHLPRSYQVFLAALKELNRTGLLQTLQKQHVDTPHSQNVTRNGITTNVTFTKQSDLSSLVQQIGGHSGYSLRCTRATQYDEEDLVENFRSEIIKAKINRRLIPNTHTMLYDTVSGSLMFHLKWTSQAWRQLSVERLREVLGKVVNILMEEGSKEDIESQTWNVEVCTIPNALNVRPSTADQKKALQVIAEHEEFLATELNGLRMAEQMKVCGVLSSDDVSDIQSKLDRRSRAEAFLNKIISGGETAAEAFLEQLKKARHRYHFITRHLWPEDDDDLCLMANNMGAFYQAIVDGLSPFILSKHKRELCLPEECFHNEDVIATSTQYIMAQDNEIKLRFLLVLLEEQIVLNDVYTSVRSKMSHDNTECDKRPLEKNTLHSETSAGVQLGQCTVVKEKDTKDANQKEKFADTIGYESFLTTIRRYIFCGSKDRLKSERLEPKQIPTDDSADNDNDVKIFRGRNNLPVDETSFQDEGYFTIKIDKQSKQEKL
ncbi:uncharacterized protein LOC128246509 isoform X2 [Mya arenaria]|uniref:uncharacterized protein LOC128246509 isoform X2 n=1 Tax=Mya arenaria TaxID=6604 RepID=UPI0022E0CA73|nr:uncharacterized protein LOC128246509 isoform X2 [Mya arenaria]